MWETPGVYHRQDGEKIAEHVRKTSTTSPKISIVTHDPSVKNHHPHAAEINEKETMASALQKRQFAIVALFFQAIFVILFAFFGKYDANALPGGDESTAYVNTNYPLFQDIHVMMFVGFGFLMTFLRRYGFSAVSLNLVLTAFVIEWSLILRGFLSHDFHDQGKFSINIFSLMTADFGAAVVLISMGAMLGKLSPVQYLLMAFIETTIGHICEHVVVEILHVNDVGGSIVVHTFGAYFGLSMARAMHKKAVIEHENEGSVYHSDIFSMIGTVFLWCFWPSFNAAIAKPEDARFRAILNTYVSMAACTLTAFLVSSIVDKTGRFNMIHVQNSTLAGGVAIGTTANVVLEPYHAMLVGCVAAVVSVVGYQYITPRLAVKLGIHDTCGVHDLHGMPGVLAGLLGAFFALVYDPDRYGSSIHDIYPQFIGGEHSGIRDRGSQALYQLAGLGLTLLAAIIGGAITGLFLRLPIWNQVKESELYADGDYFETSPDYDFSTRIVTRIDHIELTESSALNRHEHQ